MYVPISHPTESSSSASSRALPVVYHPGAIHTDGLPHPSAALQKALNSRDKGTWFLSRKMSRENSLASPLSHMTPTLLANLMLILLNWQPASQRRARERAKP